MTISKNQPYHVAIIGGGFSGAMLAVHLSKLEPKWRILLIDKRGWFGPGVAYGTEDLHHLLNVPAGKMSAFADQPDHFLEWLAVHREELVQLEIHQVSEADFLPRKIYGRYLRDVFNEALEERDGLETTEADIVDIEPQRDHLVLMGSNGEEISAQKVVLALGNFAPGDPPTKDRRFHSSPLYLNQPWAPSMLDQISRDPDVLILGAGLTALDLLVSLEAKKSKGRIHVVSRHGLFPQAHRSYVPKPDWFKKQELPNTVRGLLRLLRHEIQLAAHFSYG